MAAGEQRVALVSGASRGIGAEIARQLAADHGFLVLAGARNPDDLDAGHGMAGVRLDVTEQASVDAARERIEADPGHLDVLVNNAGIYGSHGSIGGTDLDQVRSIFETNTLGALRLTQAMLPLLRRSGDPRIVNVSSGAGQLADMDGGGVGYRISKVALNAITRVLAAEEPGIRTSSLCPGWVRTDMGGSSAPRSLAEGADTAVWLATDPGVASGGFYRDREPIPW